ncbi:MAG TPA: hypothetical protein VF021_02050, partial [Longimicrobiales bacterium]
MKEVETRAHVLSNGHYSVLITRGGGGVSALDGYALTRWQPDPTVDGYGTLVYLRDLETARYWSLGTASAPSDASGGVRTAADHAELWSVCSGIETRCMVTVAKAHNTEARSLRITNQTERARTIELTTFAELSLNTPGADAAHPAFSKLFVETDFDETRKALIAWRRGRSPEDRPVFVGQRLVGARSIEYETDRARFIGRRRTTQDPRALIATAPLSGTVGAVLDPVFALRTVLTLSPGAETTVVLHMCAADSRAELDQLLDAAGTDACATADGVTALGLPDAWARTIDFGLGDDQWQGTAAARPRPLPSSEDFGGFSSDGTEYVIPVADDIAPTPQPWINVLANEQFGCLISENGAGYTWAANSRENRLTPWSNDPLSDPCSELVYLADVDTGDLWSPLAAPCAVAHGFGYSRFTRRSHDLEQSTVVFVPRADPVKCVYATITNRGRQSRRLRFVGYAQLVLGTVAPETRATVRTWQDGHVIFATNEQRAEFSARVAFAAALSSTPATARAATGSRASFLRDPA